MYDGWIRRASTPIHKERETKEGKIADVPRLSALIPPPGNKDRNREKKRLCIDDKERPTERKRADLLRLSALIPPPGTKRQKNGNTDRNRERKRCIEIHKERKRHKKREIELTYQDCLH